MTITLETIVYVLAFVLGSIAFYLVTFKTGEKN